MFPLQKSTEPPPRRGPGCKLKLRPGSPGKVHTRTVSRKDNARVGRWFDCWSILSEPTLRSHTTSVACFHTPPRYESNPSASCYKPAGTAGNWLNAQTRKCHSCRPTPLL